MTKRTELPAPDISPAADDAEARMDADKAAQEAIDAAMGNSAARFCLMRVMGPNNEEASIDMIGENHDQFVARSVPEDMSDARWGELIRPGFDQLEADRRDGRNASQTVASIRSKEASDEPQPGEPDEFGFYDNMPLKEQVEILALTLMENHGSEIGNPRGGGTSRPGGEGAIEMACRLLRPSGKIELLRAPGGLIVPRASD